MISILFATALAVAAFDASETLVAVALNGTPDGGSSLSVHDAATGAPLSAVSFPDRTHGLFFCGSKALMAWTEEAVVRIDPRSGAQEEVMRLARGERIAVAPGCHSIAIFGADRKDATVFFLASRRKFNVEMPQGTRAACYSGDETLVLLLATTGALFEAELQKKRRRTPLPAPQSGDTFGIACFGKQGLAIGGLQVELRATAAAASGTRLPLACSLEHHACSVSADGRTVATVSDESGRRLKAIRFHSTSRLKGLATVPLPEEATTVTLNPSGAAAVVTVAQGPALLVSRANGSILKLAPPGARIPE